MGKHTTDDFFSKVNKTEKCWLWEGPRTKDGYGNCNFDGPGKLAHRVSFLMHYGRIPEGLCVLHSCDNPPCVRPDHLFLGTRKDNTQDAIRKGRFKGKLRDPTDDIPWQNLTELRQLRKRMSLEELSRAFAYREGGSPGIINSKR